MSVEITIDTENAAFENIEALELAHILQDLAEELSRSGQIQPRELRDTAGMKVGHIGFDAMKLTKIRVTGGTVAMAIADLLHLRSAYYAVTPHPDDEWQIEFKPEHQAAVTEYLAYRSGARRS